MEYHLWYKLPKKSRHLTLRIRRYANFEYGAGTEIVLVGAIKSQIGL